MFREPIFKAAIVLGHIFPILATAQSTQRIDASAPVSCRRCSITLTKIATLGSISDEDFPALAPNFEFSTNSKGEFFLPSLGIDQVAVYNRSGKFLRTIGRRGDGPGEFQAILSIATGANDSLFVLSLGRVSVYTSAFSLVRTVPLAFGAYGAFIALPNGDIVVDAGGANQAPEPLRFVSATGKATPVGPAINVPAAKCGRCGAYLVSPAAAPGQFWIAGPNTYHIERRNSKGELLQRMQMDNSPWFRAWPRVPAVNPDDPPPTRLRSLQEDAQGQLWALAEGPSSKWRSMPPVGLSGKQGRTQLKGPSGGIVPSLQSAARFNTFVEVINPTTARVIVSTTFAGRILRMLAPGLLAEAREDSDGAGVWDIFRAEIKKP